MANTDAWMPLYIGDYLRKTMRLTAEQHGAYLLLIMDYWQNGPAPDNDTVLSQIARLTPDAWSNARSILAQYFDVRDGHWFHNRLEEELAEASRRKGSAKAKAAAAARARWGKKKQASDAPSIAPSIAPSTPQAMPQECPSPSPSPLREAIAADSEIPSARARDSEDAAGLLEGFSDLCVEIFGSAPNACMTLAPREMTAAKELLLAGLSVADVLSRARRPLERKRDRGEGPPGSLAYVRQAVLDERAAERDAKSRLKDVEEQINALWHTPEGIRYQVACEMTSVLNRPVFREALTDAQRAAYDRLKAEQRELEAKLGKTLPRSA